MFFELNQPMELLTPIIYPGGVGKVNSLFMANGVLSREDTHIQSPSIESEFNEYNVVTKDNSYENNDNNQQQYDLLESFDFPVISELEDMPYDKYLNSSSCITNTIDILLPSNSDDSVFEPVVDDDASSWIGRECTVESDSQLDDMMVPPSPVYSTTSDSSSIVEKRVTKKRSFSTTERKSRKKDQNKTAAEKYRLKKKSERNELNTRHAVLKNQNQELKFELDNITFRLEQFKQLFVDVLQIPIPPTK